MTPKERAAMQQALEALEKANHFHDYENEITTLREALEHSDEANEMVVGWDRVKPEAIASDPLYQQGFVDGVEEGRNQVIEQTEQEPKYFGLTHDHTWLSIDKKQYDKLKPEGRMACYAAPVRTKDLTDDEIMKINVDTAGIVPTCDRQFHFARAVIAADREKNK